MSAPNGEFGGVVVRSLKTAGHIMQPGDEIPAELSRGWTIANRQALAGSGIVRWHTRPDIDENSEKVSQSSDPVRRGRPPKAKE